MCEGGGEVLRVCVCVSEWLNSSVLGLTTPGLCVRCV